MDGIISSEVQVKIDETQTLAKTYENYTIDSIEKYQFSAQDLKAVKAKAKELTETRMSLTRPIEESKKKIIALFNAPLEFLVKAEGSIKRAMVGWQDEQEKIRQAEQARLDKLQQEKEAKLRAAAEKEAARIANLKTDAAKERATAKAEELKAQADATAEAQMVVESKVEEVSGISTRKVWKFEVVDINELPREYMVADEAYIGKIVRASQGKKEIPGVKIYSENIIASR